MKKGAIPIFTCSCFIAIFTRFFLPFDPSCRLYAEITLHCGSYNRSFAGRMNVQLENSYMEPIADKKKAIFKSTMELVREHGFHGTPMSMVAKHAGVAAGTIYHYFESKDQLICELFGYAQQQVIAVMEQEDCATIPFKECFSNLWMGLYTFYCNNQDILRFFEQFVNSPYSAASPPLEEDKFYTLFFAFFERGIREGELKEVSPRILGMLAHSSILSMAKMTASGRLSFENKELEQIHELLWSGMARHRQL